MVDNISIEEAEKIFDSDILAKGVNNVKSSINVSLYQYEFDALVILSFNIPLLSKTAPKLCSLINSKDYLGGAKQILDITKSGGEVFRGLVIRRELEYKMFTENIYIDRDTGKEII